MHKLHVRMQNVSMDHVGSTLIKTCLIFFMISIYFYLVPGLQNNVGGNTGMSNVYIMLAIWFALALLLFLFRPRSLRSNRDHIGKPTNQV